MEAPRNNDFLSRVAQRARIPKEDAGALINGFMGALTVILQEDTWHQVRDLVPMETSVEWEAPPADDRPTVEQFLLEMSKRESVEPDRAADHARAVAGAIRERASDEELDRLAASIHNDDVLALFESVRGELSAPARPTEGEEAIQTPAKDLEDPATTERDDSPQEEDQ